MKSKMLKKIFLMVFIVSAVMAFTISAVSASSEKIVNGNGYTHISSENKYYTLQTKDFFKVDGYYNHAGDEYYSLKLKKSIKNTYKINSMKIRYAHYKNGGIKETKDITIKSKDKSSILIKIPNRDFDYYAILSSQVNFQKNGKNGSIKLLDPNDDTWVTNTLYNGKYAKIFTSEKGYSHDNLKGQGRFPITTYNKIKINTKSSKYKLKYVQVNYVQSVSGDIVPFIFKGHGKTTMTINTPAKYLQFSPWDFRIIYY
jgi:hypothetical protein